MQVQHSRITKNNATSNVQTAFDRKKFPINSKIPDIPVKTEFPDISWFSRKWEPMSVILKSAKELASHQLQYLSKKDDSKCSAM